jgi:F-type H+-transporting ATPase subunit b
MNMIKARTSSRVARRLAAAALLALMLHLSPLSALPQEQSPAPQSPPPSQQNPSTQSDATAKKDTHDSSHPKGFGGELAEETRESTGAEGEEHADLKHSAMVRLLARATGLSIHGAHLLALGLNFGVIMVLVIWAAGKYLPPMFRKRSEAIQLALQEARAASEDANRRLADIESRLSRLDVEIEQMQSTAEKEANAEAERIQKAGEEDIRKVVRAAEQEIARAAKQARRELSTHTADLAIALARKQINVDSNTDQVLVRTFAVHLASPDSSNSDGGGKDGR